MPRKAAYTVKKAHSGNKLVRQEQSDWDGRGLQLAHASQAGMPGAPKRQRGL
jgi:hypothetical protein